MTELVLDPVALAWAIAGVVLGLLIGRLAWGGRRRVVAVADTAALVAARSAAEDRADRATRELTAAQAAMRPLADEVDRLKRDLARATRPVEPMTPAAPLAPLTPMTPLPPIERMGSGATAVAGTGPIVVAAPDIRQLKGVGDKFAAALEAIGLGSVDRLARLNADESADADTRLGVFNGRIAKDQLVDQATLLDEGRTTEYEARFGKLGGPVLI